MKDLEIFYNICRKIGSRIPDWTQGIGGNISLKFEDKLWIKASGYRLDQITELTGTATLPLIKAQNWILNELDNITDDDYGSFIKKLSDPNLPRASMESGFHLILPRKFVVHFHSLCSLAMSHMFFHEQKKFESWVLIELGPNWNSDLGIIDIVLPGLELSKRVRPFSECRFILLKNHGVILQGDNLNVLEKWEYLEKTFCKQFNYRFQRTDNEVETIKSHAQLCPMVLPDQALFSKRMSEMMIPIGSSGKMRLDVLKANQDTNCYELWLASVILKKEVSDIEEIPMALSKKLAQLTVEQYRMVKDS